MRHIAVKMPDVLIELMSQLVEEKKYPNRSTIVRYAVIDLLRREGKI
ncbi:CopG family transcriptional regulator [Candidatus Bathyarchaeota archaeon]|nr:MAG: CopG family transcriptional regulator [Candidatus Bathyarchaeota archaeon]